MKGFNSPLITSVIIFRVIVSLFEPEKQIKTSIFCYVCPILIQSFMPGWNLKSFNPVARSYWLAHMGVQFVPSWNAQLRCYCFLRHSFWPLRGYSRFVLKEYCKSLGLLWHDGTCRKRYSPTWQQPKITLFEASNRRDPAGSICRSCFWVLFILFKHAATMAVSP